MLHFCGISSDIFWLFLIFFTTYSPRVTPEDFDIRHSRNPKSGYRKQRWQPSPDNFQISHSHMSEVLWSNILTPVYWDLVSFSFKNTAKCLKYFTSWESSLCIQATWWSCTSDQSCCLSCRLILIVMVRLLRSVAESADFSYYVWMYQNVWYNLNNIHVIIQITLSSGHTPDLRGRPIPCLLLTTLTTARSFLTYRDIYPYCDSTRYAQCPGQ